MTTLDTTAASVIPSGRAKAMSAVRVVLHVAVVVAIVLSLLGVANGAAIVFGVIVAAAFAVRSRRVGIRFTNTGVVVDNYFKSYNVPSLAGATLHHYVRNRTELEVNDGSQFFVQAATLLSDHDHTVFLDELEARGVAIVASVESQK